MKVLIYESHSDAHSTKPKKTISATETPDICKFVAKKLEAIPGRMFAKINISTHKVWIQLLTLHGIKITHFDVKNDQISQLDEMVQNRIQNAKQEAAKRASEHRYQALKQQLKLEAFKSI